MIKDKIGQMEQYLEELEMIMPASFKQYDRSLEKKAACERYVEKIVEACVDLAFIVIKARNMRIPEDDAQAFAILQGAGIIDDKLAKRLQNAKGMRNVIAHQYSRVDDAVVFETISGHLKKDMTDFIRKIQLKVK